MQDEDLEKSFDESLEESLEESVESSDELFQEESSELPSLESEEIDSDIAMDSPELESELGEFAATTEIEEIEFIEEDRVQSILESILFAADKPLSLALIKQAFQGTAVRSEQIRRGLEALKVEYAGGKRGVTLEEISNGYQLRTKMDNRDYLRRMSKVRPFKLSGPALEVLAIVAYKQPVIKSEIDQIRGVESGHLLRALMEKHLVHFGGKSEFPGKPMLYCTGRRFLEVFGLRNLKELPSLSEIDELLPDGIGAPEEENAKLSDLTGELSESAVGSYSIGEEELLKITNDLQSIAPTTAFFEEEKRRAKQQRDDERALARGLREGAASAPIEITTSVVGDITTSDLSEIDRSDVTDEPDLDDFVN